MPSWCTKRDLYNITEKFISAIERPLALVDQFFYKKADFKIINEPEKFIFKASSPISIAMLMDDRQVDWVSQFKAIQKYSTPKQFVCKHFCWERTRCNIRANFIDPQQAMAWRSVLTLHKIKAALRRSTKTLLCGERLKTNLIFLVRAKRFNDWHYSNDNRCKWHWLKMFKLSNCSGANFTIHWIWSRNFLEKELAHWMALVCEP